MDHECGVAAGHVPQEDALWRRIQDRADYLEWDRDNGRWWVRPNKPSLRFDPDLSAFWAEVLSLGHGLGPQAAFDGDERFTLVWELAVAAARAVGFEVEHTPQGSAAPSCAHSSVFLPPDVDAADRGVMNDLMLKLSRVMTLAEGTIRTPPPD